MWQRFAYQLDFETKQGIWVLSRASFPGKVDIWDAGGEKGGKSRLKLSEVRENWKSFKMSSDKDDIGMSMFKNLLQIRKGLLA